MAGYLTFEDNEILTAAQVNEFLMGQAVPRFASEAARDAALPTPVNGQLSYVTGVGLQLRSPFGWTNVIGITSYTTAERPDPDDLDPGTTIYDTDLDRPLFTTGTAWVDPAPVTSVAGRTGTVTLTKVDVGLSDVDNTSDAAKPVSTATQTALDLKAPKAGPTFTGTVVATSIAMTGVFTRHTDRHPSERWTSVRGDSSVASASPVSGNMFLWPVDFSYPELINGLAWEVTVQGVDAGGSTDDLRFGLYADSGRRMPIGAPLFTSAVQDLEAGAPGIKTLAVSWQLGAAGRFWFACVRQVTGTPATAAALRVSTAVGGVQPFTSESTTPTLGTVGGPSNRMMVQTGVTGALPTIATVATTGGQAPVVAFKVA